MLITVYMPAFNYGDFIEEAIESVINQSIDSWELIVINDGSTDHTRSLLEKYSSNSQITIVHQENQGLNVSNNIGLRLARGKYIMRLDADDYLDENALQILSNALEKNKTADLAFPDYYEVNKDGEILNLTRREKINEKSVMDMPAHGACTMYRTNVLKSLGGYLEDFQCQDGYELWIRFIKDHNPINLNIPLFYYRQHGKSLTKNKNKILTTRREIKKKFFDVNELGNHLKVVAIVFAARNTNYKKNDALIKLADKPMIDYTLEATLECSEISEIVVSTPDQDIVDHIKNNFNSIKTHIRDASDFDKDREYFAEHILNNEELDNQNPDLVMLLNVNSPLKKSEHLKWAIHTLKIFDVDKVISVDEELKTIYQHTDNGLEALNNVSNNIKLERDALFTENGAITLVKRSKLINVTQQDTISHIAMLPEESVRINSDYEFWLAERILHDLNK